MLGWVTRLPKKDLWRLLVWDFYRPDAIPVMQSIVHESSLIVLPLLLCLHPNGICIDGHCLSVCLSLPCRAISWEQKGIISENWQEGSPRYGSLVNSFRGRMVKCRGTILVARSLCVLQRCQCPIRQLVYNMDVQWMTSVLFQAASSGWLFTVQVTTCMWWGHIVPAHYRWILVELVGLHCLLVRRYWHQWANERFGDPPPR